MKRICFYLLYLIVFISVVAKPTDISEAVFKGNEVAFEAESVFPKYTLNYDEESNIIFIEFLNSVLKEKIPEELNNEYFENVDTLTYEKNTDVFITLKKDITFSKEMDSKNKSLKLIFGSKRKEKQYTIVIDAGHGGKDPGAVGIGGVQEKDLALKVALLLKEKLSNDYNTKLTRAGDYFIPLSDRPQVANDIKADLFISIHFNAMPPNQDANGIEVFYYSRNESKYSSMIASYENSVDEKYGIKTKVADIIVNDLFYKINQEKSIPLAKLMVDNIVEKTGFEKRPQGGVYGANFAVLRGSQMPSVLVELGFLTNKEDAKMAVDEKYQLKMAEAMVIALRQYFHKKGE